MAKKRWGMYIDEDQLVWLRGIASDAQVGVATVISEIIAREMKSKSSRIKDDLSQYRVRLQLQKTNDQVMALEARRQQLISRLGESAKTKNKEWVGVSV